jgi:tetratricopeptide (TPR) repeat protein
LLKINKVRKESLNQLTGHFSRIKSFHQQEQSLLKKIKATENKEENQLKLARLYMQENQSSLALPILEKLQQTLPQSDEVFFFLGCIKTLHSKLAESTDYFKKTISINPKFSKDIELFHQKLGDEFLGFANYFKTKPDRQPSVTYMIKKGLQLAPNHQKLLSELEEIISRDIRPGQTDPTTKPESWLNFITENPEIFSRLNPELISNIYLQLGTNNIKENQATKGLTSFQKGLEIYPENNNLHCAIIDTFFATGDFNHAIEALNKAITIDSEFATYWEIIGDNLQSDHQYEDAIMAYERCFVSLPQNITLLKKIGDCYQATDQLEAAQSAYQQLKNKLEELDTLTDRVQ